MDAAWSGWPSHRPLSRSLIGRIGRKGRDPAVVELAEGSCPAVVEGHETSQQSSHGPPSLGCPPYAVTGRVDAGGSPQTVHTVGNSGIRSRPSPISWIRPLWPPYRGIYISSCPKGQVRTARTALGERSSGGHREPGSRVARPADEVLGRRTGDSGLVRSRREADRLVLLQFLRALSCLGLSAAAPARRGRARQRLR